MKQLVEYLNENLDEFVFELKSQTYLNAYKKAKKINDPRAEKFLQAFKDNIDNELIDEINSDKENEFNTYYNADKKSIVRLKGLAKNKRGGAFLSESSYGTYLDIHNNELRFDALVYVVPNKDKDRQIFLRQSIIKQGNWDIVAKKFDKIGEKINDSEAKKAFTYVQMFTGSSSIDFFYVIDTDNFIPVSLRQDEGKYTDDACLDHYAEEDKTAINAICKAVNQNHKDI